MKKEGRKEGRLVERKGKERKGKENEQVEGGKEGKKGSRYELIEKGCVWMR